MRKKLLIGISLGLSIVLLLSTTVLAVTWTFSFPITVTDTSNTTRNYYPVILNSTGQQYINAGYINSDGLNTNMQIGSTSIKYMIGTTKMLTVVPQLPSGGKSVVTFYTGYSPQQTSFPIITGDGGYVTTNDTASLEFAANATLSVSGYMDTSAGASKYILNKKGSTGNLTGPAVYARVASNITADVSTSLMEQYDSSGGAVNLYNGNYTAIGENITSVTGTINAAAFYLNKVLAPTGLGEVVIRDVVTHAVIGTLGTIDVSTLSATATWHIFRSTPVYVGISQNITVTFEYSGGDAANYVKGYTSAADVYAGGITTFILTGVWGNNAATDATMQVYMQAGAVAATGVTSGVHSITVGRDGMLFNGSSTKAITGALPGADVVYGAALWFEPTTTITAASPASADADLIGFDDGATYEFIALGPYVAGVANETLTIMHDANRTCVQSYTFTSGNWYHVAIRWDGVSKYQIFINGVQQTTVNNGADAALMTDANFIQLAQNLGAYFGGTIAEVKVYGSAPSVANLLSDYQGNPYLGSNLIGYYKVNETSGGTLADSSGNGFNMTVTGTANALGSKVWTIFVDGVQATQVIGEPTSPDNVNAYTLFQNNVMPYADNFTLSVNGVEKIKYRPNTMIQGTTLPDLDSTKDGDITFGTNTNISLHAGTMVSSNSTVSTTSNTSIGFTMPTVSLPNNWFGGGTTTTLPFYDMFSAVSTSSGMSTQMIYFIIAIAFAFLAMLLVMRFTRSNLLGIIVFNSILFMGTSNNVVPMWVAFSSTLVQFGILYLSRQV